MNNHTPGPWYRDNDGYIWRRPLNELYEYGGRVAGDKPVAAVWKGWDGEDQIGYPVEANARLIAAAPEMYELLTRVATSTNSGYGSMMSAAALADTLRDLSSQAKQLLAKIEGGGE